MIRKATKADVSRIAEILVFVKRVKFRPIFQDDDYSFGELQVLPVAEQYGKPDMLEHILVYDDGGIVKGLIRIEGNEIVELYVDVFFWNQGIGSALIEHAKAHYPVAFLWAIEKNTDAIRFYERHGFHLTDTKKFEEVNPTTLEDAISFYGENEPRGEYVLVIEGKSLKEQDEEKRLSWQEMSIEEHMKFYEDAGVPHKDAMKKVAADRGVGKREIYKALLEND